MAHQCRVAQDRRLLSRIPALMECRFTDAGASYRALIVNLSFDGAFLSAKHLPPKGAEISITISHPAAKAPLILHGKVIRGGWGSSEVGILGRFGVRFSAPPMELISLLKSLNQMRQAGSQGRLTPVK